MEKADYGVRVNGSADEQKPKEILLFFVNWGSLVTLVPMERREEIESF